MITMSVKSNLHQRFCDNLRAVRKGLHLTQDEVANRLGIAQPTYAAYETGRASPRLDLVEAVSKALGLKDPSTLLRETSQRRHDAAAAKAHDSKPHMKRTKKVVSREA